MAVLEHQILTGLHTRTGAAPNNLEAASRGGNRPARAVAKDPLVLDFLGLTEEAQEHAMEEAMTLRMAQTLAEFGPGFAFVGRQYHLASTVTTSSSTFCCTTYRQTVTLWSN